MGENGVWVELAKSRDPLETRRAYVGYVRINGAHSIRLLSDDQNGKMPKFEHSITPAWVPFTMGNSDEFISNNEYTSSAKLKNEELIEFEIIERNNQKWHGLEIGVFSHADQSDLVTLR